VAAPPADGDLETLAGVVSTCLTFLGSDPSLMHGLRALYMFGVRPACEQAEAFARELIDRWDRVREGGAEPSGNIEDWVNARIDLDEAIHSLFHLPVAAPGSWWSRLQDLARATLFRAGTRASRAGCDVRLQKLAGNFQSINHLIVPDSPQIDERPPGHVFACLLVWGRIDGKEQKGRVVYSAP
jgi:hypothetical protein